MTQNLKYLALTFALSTLALMLFYPKVVFSPNSHLFYSHGDGLKNYYTIGYYVNYDEDFWVSASHYPYGELNIYTDNQPIISHTLHLINKHIVNIDDNIVGIINLLMLFSIVIASFIIYLIFLHFRGPPILSIILSILIAFLSPQIARFEGHYSLSYVFFIPLVLYLAIKVLDTDKVLKYSLLLFGIVAFQSFVHTYYLFINICFLGAILFVLIFIKRRNKWPRGLGIGLSILAASVLFLVYNLAFDTVIDRPAAPWGISRYVASLRGTFLPDIGPIAKFLRSTITNYNIEFEARGHIGMACTLILLMAIGDRIKNKKPINATMILIVLAATLVWIFGTNIINKLSNYAIYEIIPKFRQFRGLGRLSWVFYYAITIGCGLWVSQTWRRNNPKMQLLIIGLLAFWALEVSLYNHSIAKKLNDTNFRLSKDENKIFEHLSQAGIEFSKYQAILLLPYYFVGNEKFAMQRQILGMWDAMGVSYTTGIPLIDHLGSRTSISQSISQFQLFKDSIVIKEVLPFLNEKDILIMSNNAEIKYGEGYLLKEENLLTKFGIFSFYRLPISLLDEANSNVLADFYAKEAFLAEFNSQLIVPQDTGMLVSANTYDDQKEDFTLFGSGSSVFKTGQHVPIPIGDRTKETRITFWMYVNPQQMGMPTLYAKWVGIDNRWLGQDQIEFDDPYTYKGWIQVSIDVPTDPEIRKCLFYSENMNITIDNLLVYHQGVISYQIVNDSVLLQNNVPIVENLTTTRK